MEAYDREDYATALKEWQPLAEQGDAYAQVQLGAGCTSLAKACHRIMAKQPAGIDKRLNRATPGVSLTWEAHTTLAKACRRIMCKPTCGAT